MNKIVQDWYTVCLNMVQCLLVYSKKSFYVHQKYVSTGDDKHCPVKTLKLHACNELTFITTLTGQVNNKKKRFIYVM